MKMIHHVATLDYYDGPILFEARDRIGGHYLALAADTRDGDPAYAVVGVSPERLSEFRGGLVDLRDVMLEAGSEEWYVALPSPTTEGFDLELQATELAASDYLPNSGYTLNAAATSDMAVLDAARRRDNLVIELKAEPPEAREGHRMHVRSLVQLLDLMQKLVNHAYRAARRELPSGWRSTVSVEEAVLMDVVVPAMPGSFCMLLEAGNRRDKLSENELSQGLRRVDALFEHATTRNATPAVAFLRDTGGRLASTYLKLLNFLAEERVGFHYTWAEPSFSRARQHSISAARARRLSRHIEEMVEFDIEEVSLEGRLVKADLKTGSWRLESGRRIHKGTVDDGSLLSGLVVGQRYRFSCIAKIERGEATGKEVWTLQLETTDDV